VLEEEGAGAFEGVDGYAGVGTMKVALELVVLSW